MRSCRGEGGRPGRPDDFRGGRRSRFPRRAYRAAAQRGPTHGRPARDRAGGNIRAGAAIARQGAIHLAEPADARTAERVHALFLTLAREHPGTFRLVERGQLDALGADPGELLRLEPLEGYAVNDRFDGDTFLAPAPVRGHHGFLPDAPGMHAGLLLSGPDVEPGVRLPVVRQVDVAPTVAHVLGFGMPQTDGAPRLTL